MVSPGFQSFFDNPLPPLLTNRYLTHFNLVIFSDYRNLVISLQLDTARCGMSKASASDWSQARTRPYCPGSKAHFPDLRNIPARRIEPVFGSIWRSAKIEIPLYGYASRQRESI